MPANLPPQYHQAEQRFREARTIPEKIEALEAMLAIIPKHKGTEHLQGDIKRRMAKLRAEAEKKGGRRGFSMAVEREGAGQVVLVGAPNAGKSSLVSRLTNARPEVADYPFTTRRPVAGMMPYENIQIQLVDLPAISPEYMEPWVPGLVRPADLVLLVADLGRMDMIEQVDAVEGILEGGRITLAGDPGKAPAEAGRSAKKTLLVANKADVSGAADALEILKEFYAGRCPILEVSAREGKGLEELKAAIYGALGILRVYTKPPGKEASLGAPVVLPVGSTVLDFAAAIHKDFASQLKYARIWGKGLYEGQKVQRDFALREGDIVELHI